MKIQCNVCEKAEATVLCCADEAALCGRCDREVHAANKLVSKHQRVPLSTSSSQMPLCDICQETVGYFFCLEDRALLCRKCDVAIHTTNSLVSVHQRFLLTGVKVGLEATEPCPPTSLANMHCHTNQSSSLANMHSHTNERIEPPEDLANSNRTTAPSSTGQYNRSFPVQTGVSEDFSASKLPFAGGSSTGNISQWQLDEFFSGIGDCNQNYSFMDNDSSKADSGKLGGSDCSPILRAADGELEVDDCMPDSFWAVPQMPSPPTASGLHWAKETRDFSDFAAFVPDIGSSPLPNFHHRHSHGDITKRRRRF